MQESPPGGVVLIDQARRTNRVVDPRAPLGDDVEAMLKAFATVTV